LPHASDAECPVVIDDDTAEDAVSETGDWNAEEKLSSSSTTEFGLKLLSALCNRDAASFTNRDKVFSAVEEREVSVNNASKSELHMFITSRVMLMVWPNDFLDINGAAAAACAKTFGGATAAAPPKPNAAGSAAACGAGSLEILSLRMFTKRESNADCASTIFSNDPQGGGCGGCIFII
jgi:hypothetical protein